MYINVIGAKVRHSVGCSDSLNKKSKNYVLSFVDTLSKFSKIGKAKLFLWLMILLSQFALTLVNFEETIDKELTNIKQKEVYMIEYTTSTRSSCIVLTNQDRGNRPTSEATELL